MTKRTLYLDMDDVVADWRGEAIRLLALEFDANQWSLSNDERSRLCESGRFYRNLPLLPGAHELVAWAKEYAHTNRLDLAFLTAVPYKIPMPFVYFDKVHWANENFPGIPVFFGPTSKEKQKHCKRGDILIDDKPSNCMEWRLAGGIAHQYTTWENCKHWIENELRFTLF